MNRSKLGPSKQLNQFRGKHRSACYEICIEGQLDGRWERWFEELVVTCGADEQTIIRGEFDQSALHGLFNRIRDLGITLISVQRCSN